MSSKQRSKGSRDSKGTSARSRGSRKHLPEVGWSGDDNTSLPSEVVPSIVAAPTEPNKKKENDEKPARRWQAIPSDDLQTWQHEIATFANRVIFPKVKFYVFNTDVDRFSKHKSSLCRKVRRRFACSNLAYEANQRFIVGSSCL